MPDEKWRNIDWAARKNRYGLEGGGSLSKMLKSLREWIEKHGSVDGFVIEEPNVEKPMPKGKIIRRGKK